MANTTEHISIRLPRDLISQIDVEMLADSRSRSKVIELRLRRSYGSDGMVQTDTGTENQRSGGRTRLPVLRQPKSDAKLVHPVQPLRDQLVGGADIFRDPRMKAIACGTPAEESGAQTASAI